MSFTILHKGLTLSIEILNIDQLHLHEEVIPTLLDQLSQTIQRDGCLMHPVIVDTNSHVVLDGTHRVAALKKLNCKRIPACLIDYNNPLIKVGCWYRVIKGERALEHTLTQVKQLGLGVEEVVKIDDVRIGVPPIVAAVKSQERDFFIHSSFQGLKEAYDVVKKIEGGLRRLPLEVSYETESDALSKLLEDRVDVVVLTPKPTKSSIINAALSGDVFAYKTTRHIIPARPLYLNVPLSLLRNDEKPLHEINNELRRMLQKRHLKHVAAGSILNERRYEEDLYLFY